MKTALITGGAQRVGKALSRALAGRGYAVGIHYNDSAQAAAELVREIEQKGGKAARIRTDLSRVEDTEKLIDSVSRALGPPECLINNASMFSHDTALAFTADDWDKQLAVNMRAPAVLSRDFARGLPEGRDGCIINLLDQRIDDPTPNFFTYMISKCGLETLTKLNAIALAPRVRVCGVAPGLTLPSGAQTQAHFDKTHAHTLLGRGSTLIDIVKAVEYLIDADTVTGQTIFVDGGERFDAAPRDEEYVDRG